MIGHGRGLGPLLQNLKEEDSAESRNKQEASTTEGIENLEDDVGDSSHPKAIGNVLKMIQSDKDKFYEEPEPAENGKVTIFTTDRNPLHEIDDDHEAGKKIPREVKLFYCDICNISCTSQGVFDVHLIGKRHKKSLTKLKMNPDAVPSNQVPNILGKIAIIQDEAFQLAEKEPIVGLEYVTEYQFPGNTEEPRYFCEMCLFKASREEILQHVVRQKHRLRYMRTHCFDIYHKVTDYPSFSNMMKPSDAITLLRKHSAFLVRTKRGNMGQVKVKPYMGEENMRIDVFPYQQRGALHPSQHRDLIQSELLLADAAKTEREQGKRHEELKRQIREKQLALNRHLRQTNNRGRTSGAGLKRNLPTGGHVMPKIPRFPGSSFPTSSVVGGSSFAARPKVPILRQQPPHTLTGMTRQRLHQEPTPITCNEIPAASPNVSAKLHRLNQQQMRIANALRTLDASSGGHIRTPEEEVAFQKLKGVLESIKHEKQHLQSRNRARGPDMEGTGGFSGHAIEKQLYHGGLLEDDLTALTWPDSGTNDWNHGLSAAELKEDGMRLETSLQTARLRVEERINNALSKGELTSLADAFMSHPDLDTVLKRWDQKQNEYLAPKTAGRAWPPRLRGPGEEDPLILAKRGVLAARPGSSSGLQRPILPLPAGPRRRGILPPPAASIRTRKPGHFARLPGRGRPLGSTRPVQRTQFGAMYGNRAPAPGGFGRQRYF